VKGKQGEYHDALFNKNNRVEIVLHENLGGRFSPPAAQKMRRNGRKARDQDARSRPHALPGRPQDLVRQLVPH